MVNNNKMVGGCGEQGRRLGNSHESWADNESSHPEEERPKVTREERCVRCRRILTTKARCCRPCYESRSLWLPCRPTRRLRPGPRRSWKPSRESSALVHSTLPLHHRVQPDDTDSDFDYQTERLVERTKRRAYLELMRLRREKEAEEEEEEEILKVIQENEEESWVSCLRCRARPRDAIVIHGQTAHRSLCHICATRLKRDRGPCPQCGKTVQFIVKEGFI